MPGQTGMEGIESAAWLLSPVSLGRTSSPARGTITLGPDGAFKFSLPAAGLSGAQDLTLTVTSRNGNRADLTLRLAQGDSDLPSFRLEPGDRSATATWEAIPFARRYDLVLGSRRHTASTGNDDRAGDAPAKVTGLKNGSRYSLQVKATFDDGTTGVSPVTQFIPLSSQTLAPKAIGEYRADPGGLDGYSGLGRLRRVARFKSSASATKVASALASTTYVDTAVEYGTGLFLHHRPGRCPCAHECARERAQPGISRSRSWRCLAVRRLRRPGSELERGLRIRGLRRAGSADRGRVHPFRPADRGGAPHDGRVGRGSARQLRVRGGRGIGLRVFDITAPREPIEIGQRKTSNARAVVLSGTYAYIADGTRD